MLLPKSPTRRLIIAVTGIIVAFLLIFILWPRGQNQATLTADNNYFQISFDLKDKEKFEKIIDQLGLSPDVANYGIQFQLDATSSAKLSFLTPAKADFQLKDKQLIVRGQTSRPLPGEFPLTSFPLPGSASLGLAARDITEFIAPRILDPEITSFIKSNLAQKSPQYLFLTDGGFWAAFPASEPDFGALETISRSGEPIYKKETSDNLTYHFIKTTDAKTLAIFQIGQWQFLADSPQTARQIADLVISQKAPNYFAKNLTGRKTSFYLWAKNSASILGQTPVKFKSLELTLKGERFSALIEIDGSI